MALQSLSLIFMFCAVFLRCTLNVPFICTEVPFVANFQLAWSWTWLTIDKPILFDVGF